MKLAIRLFAAARDLAGSGAVFVELPSDANVGGLRVALAAQHPQLAPLASRSLVAVNAEYAQDTTPVADGDELALIPPVSGG